MTIVRTFAKVHVAAQHQEYVTGRRKAEAGMQKYSTCQMFEASSSRVP